MTAKSTADDIPDGIQFSGCVRTRPRHAAQTQRRHPRRRHASDSPRTGSSAPPCGPSRRTSASNAALVTRYFGSKQDLFATATEFRIELPDLAARGPGRHRGHAAAAILRGVGGRPGVPGAAARGGDQPGRGADTLNETLATHVAPALRAVTPDNHDTADRPDRCVRHRARDDQIHARQRARGQSQPRRTQPLGRPGLPAAPGRACADVAPSAARVRPDGRSRDRRG